MADNESESRTESVNDENRDTQQETTATQSSATQQSESSETQLLRCKKASRGSSVEKKSASRDSTSKTKKKVVARKKAAPKKAMPAQAKAKDAKTKKAAVEDDALADQVREYMKNANRPFIVTDVMVAFRNEIGKAQMQKILGMLVEEKSIYVKLYNKTPVYCAAQDAVEINADVLVELDKQLDATKSEVAALKDESDKITRMLGKMNEYPADDVLRKAIVEMEATIVQKKQRLAGIEKNGVKEDEMKRVDGEIRKLDAELRKRKSTVKRIVESLCEGTGMKKKELLDEIGIE